MLVDITGTILIPGDMGKNCPGNGLHKDEQGEWKECCCDECDYMICCTDLYRPQMCKDCGNLKCPNWHWG